MPILDCTFPLFPRTQWVIWLCAVFSLGAPILGHPLDGWDDAVGARLVSHWQWVYLLVGITCFAVLVICQARLVAADTVACSGRSLFRSNTLEYSTFQAVGFKPMLQVATANLNFAPRISAPWWAGWCLAKRRMWCFCRSSRGWHSKPSQSPAVAQRYPHRLEAPQPDQFGLAILSRYPLSRGQKVEPADSHKPPAAAGHGDLGRRPTFASVQFTPSPASIRPTPNSGTRPWSGGGLFVAFGRAGP